MYLYENRIGYSKSEVVSVITKTIASILIYMVIWWNIIYIFIHTHTQFVCNIRYNHVMSQFS